MTSFRVVFVSALLLPVPALAASAFDGTWKINPQGAKLSQKPIIFAVKNGRFSCTSCEPALSGKADGTDQAVTGHIYDAVVVTVPSPDTLIVVHKLKGKILDTLREVVSADGNTLTMEDTYVGGPQPAVYKGQMKRIAPADSGAHATSGTWLQTQLVAGSDAASTETLSMTDEGFHSSSNGQSYDAKFDGKSYPISGDPTHTRVKLKKVSPTEVVESDYVNGRLEEVYRMTVSPDGKTLDVVDHSLRGDRTDHYHFDKQP